MAGWTQIMSESREYPSRPICGVGIVVFDQQKVLLIRRGKPPRQGDWSIPGGKQKLGETLQEAARREVQEETGIEIGPLKLVDVVDSIFKDSQQRIQYHYCLIDWMGEYQSGTLNAADDAADAKWFDVNALQTLGLWDKTLEIIKKADELRKQ